MSQTAQHEPTPAPSTTIPQKSLPLRPDTTPQFKSYQVRKASLSDYHILSPSSSRQDTPEYYVEISLYNPKKRALIVHQGSTPAAPNVVSSDLKSWRGTYNLDTSLGNEQNEQITIERIDKVIGWTSRHTFFFPSSFSPVPRSSSPSPEKWIWRHKGQRQIRDGTVGIEWDDMELIRDQRDGEEDEVVARYEKRDRSYRGWKGRGRLEVKEGGGVEWERVVVGSLMALLAVRSRESV